MRGCYVRRWGAHTLLRGPKTGLMPCTLECCLSLSALRAASLTEASAHGGRRFNTEEENRHSGTDRCSRLPRQQLKAVLLLSRGACGSDKPTPDQNIETSLFVPWGKSSKIPPRKLLEIGLKGLSSLTKTLSSSNRCEGAGIVAAEPSLFRAPNSNSSPQRPFFLASAANAADACFF